ncbi:transcription factor TFIIIB component B'' homolog isoform X2 [Strigops habroptila]|uniref:transcription factor TFIIIB component B'' homolog isoform X2 n=1 Tax=Strigops habroptila TaxID=2489341 RepID=UPI0011CFB2B8|nr:transcription factor TFIIIB component B'' homolog isoform X2 [Strigops habroptila]
MFRRARLNVRPNVRPGGRSAASSAAGSATSSAADTEPQGSGSAAAVRAEAAAEAVAEPPPAAPRVESDDKADSSNGAGEASKPAEMPMQRRKRISTVPNLKPRAGPSSAQRLASKPLRQASQAPEGSASLQKDSSPSEESNVESSLKSLILPERKIPVPQVPQFSPLEKSANKEQTVDVTVQKNDDTLQKIVPSPLKERPTQERSGTQEEKLPMNPAPVKEKRVCSDRERILKARKLREMLKEELKKERMLKHRPPVIEGRSPPDRSKMTMRDLIYYLPENNPMKSSLAEEKRTEQSSALNQMKEQEEKSAPDQEDEEEEDEAENGEESQDGPLLVPRVKVAEDGSIILDEESLTVEVLRTKGPCVVEENDPIFERGSTTTYSSFRRSFYTKPWSNKETDMFFLAISMVGTDFSLIGRLFPHRARAEIKNKFKREEKANGWRIDKAFKEKRPFDFEFFAQLLEKVLADEEKRKHKTVKSQKPREKKPPRPRKKPKGAKAASTEAANDQDDSQEAGISGAETEADAVAAEKENEDALGISEQAEEQVSLEPVLAKKKRKKKKKDDLEQEGENLPEEMAVPPKIAEEGRSSKKITEKSVVCDANKDDHTTCRDKLDSVMEGKQDEAAVTEEERSESFLPVDDTIERESDVNLCSFEDSNDVILEMEPAKLSTLDTRDDISQESQISDLPVSKITSKERQAEETRETKNKDMHDLHRPDEKQSTSESDSQSEIMKTEMPVGRRRLQRPKPNLVRSSVKREASTQKKMEAETSSSNLVDADEKCSEEDSRRKRNEATEVENTALDTKSEEPEKNVIAKAIVRGCRQRFKPNITRASGKKEEPEKDAGNDTVSHPQPKEETEKNTDQSNRSDATSEEAAEKGGKVLETVPQSNGTAGLQQDGKQSVLKPTPLKRGRLQRPKPNLGRSVVRQKDLTAEKAPEEEKTEGGELEKGVIHHKDEISDPCLENDVTVHEDTQPGNVTLEGDVSTDSEMNSIQEKSSEAESCENDKGLSDILKQVPDFNTRESGPRKEEEKAVVSTAWLLKSRFQRPKPNLRMTTSRKKVLDVNNTGVSQEDTNEEGSLTQCDSECSILPDTDNAGNHQVLQPSELLGKEKSVGSQEVSESPSCKSPKKFSRSEDGELKSCLPKISQDDTSATNADKNSTGERKQTPLQPAQLVRRRFQRYKPNLVRAVVRKELQISEKKMEKNPEAEQSVLQEDESASTLIVKNEAVLCQADVLSKEEQEQQEMPQLPCISENILCEQSSAEKSTSQEGKLGALGSGQFVRKVSPRIRPNLKRAHREKESPVAQTLAAPVEEEANKGENLPVVEESEELPSSKDDMEVPLSVGSLGKDDNLDINLKSRKSQTLSSSEKSPNHHNKAEQQLSENTKGSIQDATERSNNKLSSGEEGKQSDTKPLYQVNESPWCSRPNLMRVTRKRGYPEESENREDDNSDNRNAEECLILEKPSVSMLKSSNTVEAASFLENTRKHNFTDSVGEASFKRMKQDSRLQSPELSSESESQVEQEDSQLSASKEKKSDNLTRKQSRRPSKQIVLPKHVSELRTAASSSSECGADCSEKGNQRQEVKLSVTRGKSLKTVHRKKYGKEHKSSKITLVTLRASQEEEEEADDFEPDDEDECFAPEEVNKAPVFVPIGLRSPKPIPVQIEETMEELEIPVNIPDVQVATDAESLSHASVQPVAQREGKETTIHENPEVDKGINDGSTEAAMTLLAMGDPMFQLKTSTEEWTHVLPTQDELDVASSPACSRQDRTSSQHLLSSDTSTKELVPSEDGNNINVEDQRTGTRTDVEEYFEKNATNTSGSSLPTVNSVRLTQGRLLEPEPAFGVLRSNENISQKSLNTNVLVEQLEQIQSESTTLRGTAEMQKVELEQLRPAADDSSVFHDFATRSMELNKQADKTERYIPYRTQKEMRAACEKSGELRTTSQTPEKSHLGLENCPNQSSVDGLSEQNPYPPEHNICTINFTQNEACAQDDQQQCISRTEETSVVNNDHRCPEEEQTFILTLVEIPADSKEFDASVLLEQTSEPLLPAPILITPINARETSVTEVESIGSSKTAADEFTAPLNSSMETEQLEGASVEPVPNLRTTQKRSAADLEENNFPLAKKILSTVVVEDDLETTYESYSIKSTNASRITSGNPFQKTEASAKEKVPASLLVSESMSPLADRSQLETLENLGKAPLENSASKHKEEVVSRLSSNRKAEISGQGKQGDVHESGQLEHTGSLASSSKTPLLRHGRKPLGFLSLICTKSSSETAENSKRNRGKIPKPRLVTPKRNIKNRTPSPKDDKESCSLPSTSTSSSVDYENIAADAAVMVPSNKPSEKPPLCAKDQEKEEEPTRISEYFFSDIFMEVDDSE